MLQGGPGGARHGLAQEVLDFGKDLPDGVEVWTIGRQKDEVRAGRADKPAYLFVFVAAQIAGHNDIAGLEGLNKLRLHVDREVFAIDGSAEHPGRLDPVVAQRGPQPRKGAMFVLIQVSPIKTRRLGTALA